MRMKHKTSFLDVVKYIYVYFFSAVGTVMIIIGVNQFGEYIFKSYVASEYRLDFYLEEQCDYVADEPIPYGAPFPAIPVPIHTEPQTLSDDSADEKSDRVARCRENLARERAYQQKKDLFDATMLVGLGLIVFGVHFGWMRRTFL